MGQVFVRQHSDWATGRYTTLRHIEYYSPGTRAQSPEFIAQDRGTHRIAIRLIASPEYDYAGRLVGHWCDFLVTDVHSGPYWYPEMWP